MHSKKTFIIGDVHGCLWELKSMIDKINWNPSKDRLIFIGDYIDRGEDPKGVVDFILELKKVSELVQCVMGNHEKMFLDYLSGINIQNFMMNGGRSTLRSYRDAMRNRDDEFVPSSHLDFFSSLLPLVELEKHYIVHAGFRPGILIEDQELDDMIWIRDEFLYSDYDFGKIVIFGHSAFNSPLIMENKIGIDTGAVYGNFLTCIELPEMRYHSVKSR